MYLLDMRAMEELARACDRDKSILKVFISEINKYKSCGTHEQRLMHKLSMNHRECALTAVGNLCVLFE